MQFDRAMALLLEGHNIQRPSWVRDDQNTHLKLVVSGDTSRVIREGFEVVFTRVIASTRDAGLNGADLAASDWQVVDNAATKSTVTSPPTGLDDLDGERGT